MSVLEVFLSARFDEEENAIKTRDRNLPIHFVGCYYYEYTLDINYFCDCSTIDDPTTMALAQIKAKREVIECMTEPERSLLVAILAKPYAGHPEFPNPLA